MDEGIHVARFLRGQVFLDIEALHLAREAGRIVRCVELGDVGDAGSTGDQIGPTVGNIIANRRNQPKACNDNSTAAHGTLFSIG